MTFANARGPLAAPTLVGGSRCAPAQVPFRTELGLDVLPVEGRAFFKRTLADPSQELKDRYAQLYASWAGAPPATDELQLYETVPLEPASEGVELQATADASLVGRAAAARGRPGISERGA